MSLLYVAVKLEMNVGNENVMQNVWMQTLHTLSNKISFCPAMVRVSYDIPR
jgi:hypothetical protein